MTLPIDVFAMFMLGFLGTGHCVGMCGPLVIALPGQTRRWGAHLAYHAGRISTYGIIGALMGGMGSGLVMVARLADADPLAWVTRAQVGISVPAAGFLIVFGLTRMGLMPEPRWLAIANPSNLPGWRRTARASPAKRRNRSFFRIGMLLGALPCGLSYAAFARSLASMHALNGLGLAVAFGLGTLPGLLAVGVGAGAVWRRYQLQAELIAGMIMIGMGANLLIKVLAINL